MILNKMIGKIKIDENNTVYALNVTGKLGRPITNKLFLKTNNRIRQVEMLELPYEIYSDLSNGNLSIVDSNEEHEVLTLLKNKIVNIKGFFDKNEALELKLINEVAGIDYSILKSKDYNYYDLAEILINEFDTFTSKKAISSEVLDIVVTDIIEKSEKGLIDFDIAGKVFSLTSDIAVNDMTVDNMFYLYVDKVDEDYICYVFKREDKEGTAMISILGGFGLIKKDDSYNAVDFNKLEAMQKLNMFTAKSALHKFTDILGLQTIEE